MGKFGKKKKENLKSTQIKKKGRKKKKRKKKSERTKKKEAFIKCNFITKRRIAITTIERKKKRKGWIPSKATQRN